MRAARVLARPAAWGLVALALVAGVASWLAFSASADLARGRERLLAGDTAEASAAFARSERWPGARAEARVGRAVALARSGRTVGGILPLAALEALAPEALILSSIADGYLDAAASLADLARRAGHPVGSLYAAAIAFERGGEAAARALATQSPIPLASRGLGARLHRALEARDAGAATLLLDRQGELAGAISRGGAVLPQAGLAPLVAGILERLPVPPAGDAVRLSIDLGLSRAAREALRGRRGSIVLVEPRTGAVLAAVSDERTAAAEGAAVFTQRREPGSIAKLITAAAAYRSGLDADAQIRRMTCTGVERYGGKPLWCAFPAGPLEGLDHALAVSCNVAFANLGVRVGAERLLEEYRRWGFDSGEGELLGAAGRVHAPHTPLQVADLSVGLELADVTPLHAALLAGVVANDGRLAAPRLVTGTCGPLGLHDDAPLLRTGREVIEPELARRLLRAMKEVGEHGTGSGLAPAGFPIAMKTGTASERGLGYHVNYIGVGPLPDPSVAFCVRLTGERTSPAVTAAARDVTRALLIALADRRSDLESAARRQRAVPAVAVAR